LLEKKGWKYLKKTEMNNQKVCTRVHEVSKAKHKPKYKYGVQLPDCVKLFLYCEDEYDNMAWANSNFTQEKANALIAKGFQYIRMAMLNMMGTCKLALSPEDT
jgi:hypothetical protein